MGIWGIARVKRKATVRGNRWGAFIAAGAVVLASLPTAGFALGALDSAGAPVAIPGFAALTPSSGDPQLAELVSQRAGSNARLIRFTPAGASIRGDRAVTVAVRVDENSVRAISVRSAIEAAKEQVAATTSVRIAPMSYNLGISRGYHNFAKAAVPTPALSRPLSDAAIPDLAEFRPSQGEQGKSRFAARIAPVEDLRVSGSGEQAVDVGGSYRLTRNLDVTAGVRYTQDRDRLAPLPDSSKQDSQAVYVGTQFRF